MRFVGGTVVPAVDPEEMLVATLSSCHMLSVLHPRLAWVGEVPDGAKLDHLHHEAHEMCVIANSVKTEIRVA